MRTRPLLVLLLVGAALAARGTPAAAQVPAGTIAGALPRAGGITLAVWGGGTIDALAAAAAAQGCALAAAWVTSGGQFTGHVLGAPAIVNAAFAALYPAAIPPNTALILVCRAVTAPAVATVPGDSVDRDLARRIFDGLNSERSARGLPVLAASPALEAAAAKYAALHWQRGLPLDHAVDGTEPWDRARAEGYSSFNVGEVLAAWQRSDALTPAQLAPLFVRQWLDSPPHRAIVLGETLAATELAVGCAHGKDALALNFTLCVGMTGKP